MKLSLLLEQAKNLRFDDAGLEAAYWQERQDRDALRTHRVLLGLVLLATLLGVIIVTLSARGLIPLPATWVWMRFAVLIPAMGFSWFLTGRPWGKAHLQQLLGWGLPVLVGAYSLEWCAEWTPGTPYRVLWIIPMLTLWAVVMTLAVSARTAIRTIVGALAITLAGIVVIVPQIDRPVFAAMVAAYALGGSSLVQFARWREQEHREIFLHRREAHLLADKLHVQNETLIQLNKLRDDFVAGVLHDMRSPLTSVLLGSSLIQAAPEMPVEKRTKMLEDIVQAARRADSFATGFLEQCSQESLTASPRLAEVALDGAIASAVTRAQLLAGAKGQSLVVEVAPGTIVMADELLLDRTLSNLLDNALKYSPVGEVITVRVTIDPGTPENVRIAVIDHGPGLSAAEQAQLFQAYRRLPKNTTMGESSVGLGLSLVKQWVESMGGSIGCESELDRGATFWVVLARA